MIVALRDRAEAVRQAEVERYRTRLGELDAAQLDAVEALTHGIIGKLLHDPQLALKDAAGSPRGDRLVAALRDLFALDDDAAVAVASCGSGRRRAAVRWRVWQAEHVAVAAARGRPVPSRWSSSSSTRRATGASTCRSTSSAARACSPRRCRPPSSTGAPTSPCTAPRTCRRSPCPGSCSRPCPSAAIPATRWSGSTLADLPEGAEVATGSLRRRAELLAPPAGPPDRGACAATCRRAWPRPPSTTPSSWPPPPSTASAWPTRSPSGCRSR